MSKNNYSTKNEVRFYEDQNAGIAVISKKISYEKTMSLKAKGLYCQLKMLPPTWELNEYGLSTIVSDKRSSIRSAIAELEEFGYLYREQVRKENGQMGKMIYHVFDTPRNIALLKKAKAEKEYQIHQDLLRGIFIENLPWKKDTVIEDTIANLPNYFEEAVRNENSPHPMSEIPTSEKHTEYKLNNTTNTNLIEKFKLTEEEHSTNATASPVSISKTDNEWDKTIVEELSKDYPDSLIKFALSFAKTKKDPIAYTTTILKDWKSKNLQSVEEVEEYIQQGKEKRKPKALKNSCSFYNEEVPVHLREIKPYTPTLQLDDALLPF